MEGEVTDDPYRGRTPTAHERAAGQPWDASYGDGPAPWEVGHPQATVVRLADEGAFASPVLDAGCGSGDNALHLASRGLSVVGFDVAETALEAARAKAAERGLDAAFVAADALRLQGLEGRYATVLDCGLFHSLEGDERRAYVTGLAGVTRPGATLFVLCFSDEGPDTGPHPVSQAELRATIEREGGWEVTSIVADRVETRFHDDGAPAWLATARRR